MTLPLVTLLLTAVVAALATPLFARLARRIDLVVRPREDRWHRRPTPLLGGGAIAVAALSVMAVALPLDQTTVVLLLCALGAFALGLVDDLRHLAPTTKLAGQVLVASVAAAGGVRVEIVESAPVAYVLTVLWIVGIMNAVNLMDNMDGLAAGVAAIAAIVLGITAFPTNPTATLLAAVTAGAALGFLVHNFHPARIFMGDAGSLFLGFLLGATALIHTATGATNVALAVLGPLAALGLPLFDAAFVTATRRLAGIPISQGGRDHTSHRLASFGLSDRATVLALYAVAGGLGVLAIAVEHVAGIALPLLALAVICLILFGVVLIEADVGRSAAARITDQDAGPSQFARSFAAYGRFGAEIAIDVVLLTTAYYLAYVVRFEGLDESAWLYLFTGSVPLVVGAQLGAMVVFGVYRTLWRYLTIGDVVLIVRALTVGSAAAALAILFASRFVGYSRAVFVLDWLLACAFVIGARSFLLWLLHALSSRPRQDARRVLIIGANEHGAFALRLLLRARDAAYRVVGFLDGDPGKRHRRVGGVRVVGFPEDLPSIVQGQQVDLVVLALPAEERTARDRARAVCETLGVECRDFMVAV